jgi:hypothetical protein
MKLVANKTQIYNGKQYSKYFVVIPNKQIDELDWDGGAELVAVVRDGELKIKKK